MAQFLKDDVRKAIIEAAKQEFAEKGYKEASMRTIAKKANMTVGNLYRYFKSKEEINNTIIGPTYQEFIKAIQLLKEKTVSLETRVFDLKPSFVDIKKRIEKFADKLVEIYFKNKQEFSILIDRKEISNEIINWFANTIDSMISQYFVLNDLSQEKNVLAKAYAISIYNGLVAIFKDLDSEPGVTKVLVKTYLRSYLYMLDTDIRKYTE